MTATTKTPEQLADEFVEIFRGLSEREQERRAYDIAERHLSKLTKPMNIRDTAAGVRLALLGQKLPDRCAPHWRRGFAIGRSIRDGQLRP